MDFRGVGGVPGDGPYVVLTMDISDDQISDGTFESNGCPSAHQAACAVLTFTKRRTLGQAGSLDKRDLILLAGPLPEGKDFYYDLALAALQDCLRKVREAA